MVYTQSLDPIYNAVLGKVILIGTCFFFWWIINRYLLMHGNMELITWNVGFGTDVRIYAIFSTLVFDLTKKKL